MELIATTLQTLNIDYIIKDKHNFIHKYNNYTLRIIPSCILGDYHIRLFYGDICIFGAYILAICLFNYAKLMKIVISLNLHEKYDFMQMQMQQENRIICKSDDGIVLKRIHIFIDSEISINYRCDEVVQLSESHKYQSSELHELQLSLEDFDDFYEFMQQYVRKTGMLTKCAIRN